ncbi:MAG TPA: GNAT family protein [Chroococcales cyanobacterium]
MFAFKLRIDEETDLRLLEYRHAGAYFEIIESNREYLKRWVRSPAKVRSIEEARSRIQTSLRLFAESGGFHAGLFFRGRLVGEMSFTLIQPEWATLGYWLGRDFQGRGLVTRACEALLNHAFEELGLDRMEIHCAAENVKSRAIPERLGFEIEGVIRDAHWLEDHFADQVTYSLSARKWRKRKNEGPSAREGSDSALKRLP